MVRAPLQRLMQDKVLLCLVVVGALAIFFIPIMAPDAPKKPKAQEQGFSAPQAPHAAQQQQQQHQAVQPAPKNANDLDPVLAVEFVRWWLGNSMNYSVATCRQTHDEAFKWMTPQAAQGFKACFWTPEIISGISSGAFAAAFQPVSINAKARNPDGSLVIGMTGTLMVQQTGNAPCSQQIVTDLLVRREKDGLRICGLYNYTQPTPQAPAQAAAPQMQMMAPMQPMAPTVSAAPAGPNYGSTTY